MIVLGLTGSIGMGKSATAELFREAAVPVYDADLSVHALYAPGGAAVEPLALAFPGVVKDGAVDRSLLRARVLNDAAAMKRLEAIVHPLTGEAQRAFREAGREAGAPLLVVDIPLLFETGGERACDYTLVVTAPAAIQRARVLARPGMDATTFDALLARQMPDAEKRARADFIFSTGHGFDFARAQVRALIDLMNALAEGPAR